MDPISLLMPFFSGAAGGNLIGGILKNFNLGSLGNSLAGMIGGGVGSIVLGNMLGLPAQAGGIDADSTALLGQILGGGAGGGLMTIAVSILEKMFSKTQH